MAEHLVSTEWVADHLDDPNVRVAEVSVDPKLYATGHIRNAVHFPWHTALCDRVMRDIVSRENWERLLSDAGVTPGTKLVLYGDNNNWFAAWGAWIATIYGHENVALMDGGRKKWEIDGRPFITETPHHDATHYKAPKVDLTLRARLADMVEIATGERNAQMVDVRSPDEYTGKIFAPPGVPELSVRAGRIPGAKNIPWAQAANEDGTFKSPRELKALYGGKGIDGTKPVVTYCRIGERSSHSWFALKYILGYDVINYDGSWTEYGNAVGTPIENEAGTIWPGK
ncbi:sulfurtransferase [bacterium]|nr:sulfurtransferase [bacterium]